MSRNPPPTLCDQDTSARCDLRNCAHGMAHSQTDLSDQGCTMSYLKENNPDSLLPSGALKLEKNHIQGRQWTRARDTGERVRLPWP